MEGVLSEIMGQKALVGVTHVQGVLSEMGQKALVGVTTLFRITTHYFWAASHHNYL